MKTKKVAVVTGSSSGIGSAICETLLREGYKIYGISRGETSFDNHDFVWIRADLRDGKSYKGIGAAIEEDRINLLVNNAGVALEKSGLDFTDESFAEIFDLNLKAPIRLTQELKNKLAGGLVINVSSVSDRLVGEGYALYCSSKAALNVYFDVVALEEKEIKVISLLPSYVDTSLLRKLQAGKSFDWSSVMRSDQIAELIKNIADDNTGISSGARIIVVSDALKEDLVYNEDLWAYNVDTKQLFRPEN